ncbi:internal scaffolding protein [Blackfly microvirus SF02]|uniref:Internal scaffolding protein n=1 Tax=Blackfly microvirus SF02 TaxID=2576452 RepID=A0A4P8PPV7_9VIRU|nr:internal scaffolding protein [Blackfly microvirus SF02]
MAQSTIKAPAKSSTNPKLTQEVNMEDLWTYSEDRLQRWRKAPDGSPSPTIVESVPQGESMTRQEFKDDCDVNVILERITKTGQMPTFQSKTGTYGDFTEVGDYQSAIDTVMKADKMFNEIPASLRLKFENDPQKLITYLDDPNNIEESINLGLRNPPNQPDPILTELKTLNQTLSTPKT